MVRWAWRRPLGQACGPSMAAARMSCCDVPARGRAGEGPQQCRGGTSRVRLRAAQPVHERELARELLGDRDRAPVLFAPLQRAEAQLGGGEVDVSRAKRELLRYPAPGVGQREREGLDGGARVGARHGEEARTLLARQVFAPTRIDQGEAGLRHGANDTLRLVRSAHPRGRFRHSEGRF